MSSREVEMPNCAIDRSPGRKPCSTRWKRVRVRARVGARARARARARVRGRFRAKVRARVGLQHAMEAGALVEAELYELLEASGGEWRPLRHHLDHQLSPALLLRVEEHRHCHAVRRVCCGGASSAAASYEHSSCAGKGHLPPRR